MVSQNLHLRRNVLLFIFDCIESDCRLDDIDQISLANLSSMFIIVAENWMTGSQLCRFD